MKVSDARKIEVLKHEFQKNSIQNQIWQRVLDKNY
jgi:hypothetical protein